MLGEQAHQRRVAILGGDVERRGAVIAEKVAAEAMLFGHTTAESEPPIPVPAGYDRAAHQEAERRLEGLRDVERKATRLEETAARKERAGKDLEEAAARRKESESKGLKVRQELALLSFDRARFEASREEHEAAVDGVRRGELRLTDATSRLDAAEEALARAERAEADLEAKQKTLGSLESDRRHNGELDAAFNQLRVQLNARVRPELSELASAFLSGITAGRYTALEIDDAYNVLVLDEGEEKPVISGGEEDIANLVLRLAISQMIAERAGHPLSVLILDEVFGSLDVERRDNVIQLLHGLTGRFEQVILITHIESIREGLDHVIRCTFDERSGASRVVQEDTGMLGLPELAGV